MTEAFSLLHRHRHTLFATTANEIRSRYVGSTLGMAWAVLYPFMFLGLYAVVYTVILQVRLERHTSFEYVLLIFSGLIPFIGFSEALTSSTVAVVGNKGLLKNTMFPIELLPVKSVLSSSVSMTVGLSGLILLLWSQGRASPVQLLIVPIFLLQLLFSVGVAWIVSALTVFFRDITQIVGVLVLFLMLVSPIGYTRDMIPPGMMPLVYPNPLYYIIEVYRQVLFFNVVPWTFLALYVAMSLGTFVLGYLFFNRLKPVFSEYV
jgi:lipopolysaccharide transport system permease protein